MLAAIGLSACLSCESGEKTQHHVDTDSGKKGPTAEITNSVDGQAVFEDKCKVCHGKDGGAERLGAADLTVSTLDHAAIVAVIKTGRKKMPEFASKLSAEEIEAVAKYVRTLRK